MEDKDKIREVEANIGRLLREIDKLRGQHDNKREFRDKLKQLMYWRRRRNQLGATHGNTDIDQIATEIRNISSSRKSYDWGPEDLEFFEEPF